jgi:sugar/nucleoside kinase (ribokinase family)
MDFILLGPILGEVSSELVKHIKANTTRPILLDPQGMLRVYEAGQVTHRLTRDFEAVAQNSTIIKAYELETFTVTGVDPRKDPDTAVKKLFGFGCKIAIVTLAEAGSVIYDGENIIYIPPFVVNAIDPTGAGDTYAAGFMVRYLETNDLAAVGCFASAVSSIMVENIGPDFPMTRLEVNRRAQILLNGSLQLKL